MGPSRWGARSVQALPIVLSVVALAPAAAPAADPVPLTDPAGERTIVSPAPTSDAPNDTQGAAPTARITATWPRVAVMTTRPRRLPEGGQLTSNPLSRRGVAPSKSLPAPRPGQVVSLSSVGSSDSDGTIASYHWDVFVAVTGQAITNTPNFTSDQPTLEVTAPPQGPGYIRALLTTVDSDGLKSVAQVYVPIVANIPPKVDLQRIKKLVKATVQGSPAFPGPGGGTGISPKYDDLLPVQSNVSLASVLATLPLRRDVPTRLFANAADADGEVIGYDFDVSPDSDVLVDNGRTDEIPFTPTVAGKQTYRVRVTDDEGAITEASVDLDVQAPCATPNTVIALGANVRLTPGSACVKTDKATNPTKATVEKPGELWLNGLTMSATVGSSIELLNGVVQVKIGNSLVSGLSADGTRLVLPAGPLDWIVQSDGQVSDIKFKGATLSGLPVAGWASAPTIAGGKAFTAAVNTSAPAVFGGAGAEKSTTFTAVQPGAKTTSATARAADVGGFTVGPMDLAIAGMQMTDAVLKFDGDDNWDIGGTIDLAVPLSIGNLTVAAEIRNGDFEALSADAKFTPPVPVGSTGLSVGAANFDLAFGGQHESNCVPNVGHKTISNASLRKLLQDYGWDKATTETLIADIDADYGTPKFALCGGLDFRFGDNPLGGSGSLLRGNVSLGVATYPDGRPSVVRIVGNDIRVAEIVNAKGLIEVYTNGYFNAEASAYYVLADLVRFDSRVFFEALLPKFNAGSFTQACIIPFNLGCASSEVLIGSRGAGICYKVTDPFGGKWTPGATMVWGQGPSLHLDGCDTDDVRAAIPDGGGGVKYTPVYVGAGADQNAKSAANERARVEPGKSIPVPVKAGAPGVVVTTTGERGRPAKFTLTSPNQRTVIPVSDQPPANDRLLNADGKVKIMRAPAAGITNVIIPGAPAGTWTLTAATDSVPITEVIVATGSPRPRATFKLKPLPGGERQLDLTITDQRKGIVATVLEEGQTGGQILARGALKPGQTAISRRFLPEATRPEPRQLWVHLERNGIPVARLKARRPFMSSRPPAPSVIRGLRLKRLANRILLRWDRLVNAKTYDVRIDIGDGRTLLRTVRTNGLSIKLPLRPYHAVKATVRARSRLGRAGLPASTSLAARGALPGMTLTTAERRAAQQLRR